jgi:hypothetical protein
MGERERNQGAWNVAGTMYTIQASNTLAASVDGGVFHTKCTGTAMFLFLGVAFRIVCPAVIMDGIMLL